MKRQCYWQWVLRSIILACISCTNLEQQAEELWNNPIPTPSFIHNLPTGRGDDDSRFDTCLNIKESVLFESGDTGEDIYRRIQETLRLTLNGQSVETRVYTDLLLLERYDDEGNNIGSHGGVDTVCFNLPSQDPGLYLANVQVKSTSGKEFEHSWAIKVE